ncbi:uncharacterized protein DUF4291 [Murinocardiopsis flavida]|uniref:Uncharacterized protein DUF4291 n=1 Tax=Murinocardiopsis flavida TaxID=645275 RepID=A0A2P8DTW2_9ACTN|nr:DUF4291 domain-containing protein [Murinocardiopsis flavida]PSL00658.1 uncharacterized protein DUF4291 [Murinocardiopsis flavida]
MTRAAADPSPGRRAREVYACYDDATITVYQAYPPEIADPAVEAGTFVAPFSMGRMTWIKPSFNWMMYRSGHATKEGQTRVLAIRIRRAGFTRALLESCPSHHDRSLHATIDEWRAALRAAPVRVQWDPERDPRGDPLEHRSIQIGLSGPAVHAYVGEWITGITDITPDVRRVRAAVRGGDLAAAAALAPRERRFPLDADAAARVGAD